MRISVVSDLHLEFGPFNKELPGGDVCLLAGDIMVARGMRAENKSNTKANWEDFLNQQLTKYKDVYIIMGNHEFYGSAYSDALDVLKEAVGGSHVKYLENDSVELSDDVALFGSTFWTDFNSLDYFAVQAAKVGMLDFTKIKIIGKSGDWMRIHPNDLFEINTEARLALSEFLITYANKKCIVMTHHCPTSLSSHPKWGGARNQMNYCFYNTGLENLILDSPNLHYWVHGHTHDSIDYTIGDCRVICNPRGYVGHELNPNFNPNLQITLE